MMLAITSMLLEIVGQDAKMVMWTLPALPVSTSVLLVNLELCSIPLQHHKCHLMVGSYWQVVIHAIQVAKNVWVKLAISVSPVPLRQIMCFEQCRGRVTQMNGALAR